MRQRSTTYPLGRLRTTFPRIVTLEFGCMQAQDQPPKTVARVRMSPQHAKIMSLLLRKNVQEYERRIGTIIMPDGLYQELGITDD